MTLLSEPPAAARPALACRSGPASGSGASVTSAVPGAVIRPVPRITVTPARFSRRAAAESSRPPVTSVRRTTASSQVTPWAAESSNELDGRQAR